jgi:hypothetical protein
MSTDEAPLTPREQALVKALVSALVTELRDGETEEGRERERPGGQAETLVEPMESVDGHSHNTAQPTDPPNPRL